MASEPIMVAAAHHAVRDVQTKLATWRNDVSALRSVAVTEFARRLIDLPVPAGEDFGEHAQAQADVVLDRWCKERKNLIQMITSALNPDTIVVCNIAGMAGQLGDVIGLQLDDALRDLDAELRAVIKSAWEPR
jgi:predicted NBD/HSP70 family sugar kinase